MPCSVYFAGKVSNLRKQGYIHNMGAKIEIGPEMEAEILKLYKDGLPSTHIARKLNLHPSKIDRFLQARNIRGNSNLLQMTEEQKALIIELNQQAAGWDEMCLKVGASRKAITKFLKRNDIKRIVKTPKNHMTPEMIEQLVLLYTEGLSPAQIAERLNVGRTTIMRHGKKLGILRPVWRENSLKDTSYRGIKKAMTFTIWYALKCNKAYRNSQICFSHVDYDIQTLRLHIEGLFVHPDNLTPDGEVWMNWTNYGKYDKKSWNDTDPKTWTWTLDHIVPQTALPYTSMEDGNFKRCWALSNLRPYSAKQNNIDGGRGTRHQKVG
jgi:DNA-binding CsgD family transcriptional regulator